MKRFSKTANQISSIKEMLHKEGQIMTKEKLFKLLTKIFDKYIRSKWCLPAACLIFTLIVCALFIPQKFSVNPFDETPAPVHTDELPLLTISSLDAPATIGGVSSSRGSDQLIPVNNNPWTEESLLTTLPVFRNPLEYKGGYVTNADSEKMEALLLKTIHALGLNANRLEIDTQKKYSITTAKSKDIQISVSANLTARIYLQDSLTPNKYDISLQASYKDLQKGAKYLQKKYKALLDMKKPQINISTSLHVPDAYNLSFYEGKGDLTEQIVNYNFNKIYFSGSTGVEFSTIDICQPDLSQKLGDYPIISVEKAKELLVAGNYYGAVTTKISDGEFVPFSHFPGLEYVKKVELVYLPGSDHNIFIPYYCFYVDDSYYVDLNGNYYVPAIESQYITNMPVNGVY